MFEIGGYVLSAVMLVAGLTRFRKLVPIIKDVRSLIKKYDEVTKAESEKGETITGAEWKSLAQEALNLVKDIVGWWSWRTQNK